MTRQAERERIARDLHDGLGHRLSSMALAAGAFESRGLPQAPGGPPTRRVGARGSAGRHTPRLEDVRDVVGGLRSDTDEDTGATHASLRMVAQLLADLRAAGHGVDAYVVIEGLEAVSPAREAAAFRILQESLTNALQKHAPGAPISVVLDLLAPDRGIRIRVANAMTPSAGGIPGGGRGIEGVRERARAAGGTAWIGPHEGQFIVDVELPWA